MGFAWGVVSRVTSETAFCKTCFLKKSAVTEEILSLEPTLHLKYPYRLAPLSMSAIMTSNWKESDENVTVGSHLRGYHPSQSQPEQGQEKEDCPQQGGQYESRPENSRLCLIYSVLELTLKRAKCWFSKYSKKPNKKLQNNKTKPFAIQKPSATCRRRPRNSTISDRPSTVPLCF